MRRAAVRFARRTSSRTSEGGAAAQADRPEKRRGPAVESPGDRVDRLSKSAREADGGPTTRGDLKRFNSATVPYKFAPIGRMGEKPNDQYTDFVGSRFPTLETGRNYRYYQDRGLDRLVPRTFPIKVPPWRRLAPSLREYIHFLHALDPARFTIRKIGERYGLKERTVKKVIREFGTAHYLRRVGLVSTTAEKQITREQAVLNRKEREYAKAVGYDQLGDEDLDSESDEEFHGAAETSDWIRQQTIEVEMMSAFPMMAKRDPFPKRVDVDLTVRNTDKVKVISWIDPTDKVIF
jgi:hypothetical protein